MNKFRKVKILVMNEEIIIDNWHQEIGSSDILCANYNKNELRTCQYHKGLSSLRPRYHFKAVEWCRSCNSYNVSKRYEK